MATDNDSPLIKQYFDVKAKYPQTLLLFRVGDFYEIFGKDALTAVEVLNLALTHKSNGAAGQIEMAGFPHHALDSFLPKLVRAGFRVAICDQLEDPSKTKKLVKRGVTELVTPGVSTNEAVLNVGENNFLAALHIEKQEAGVAFLDISTGEFLTAQGNFEYIDKLLSSFMPKEIIYERSKRALFNENFHCQAARFEMEDWVYTMDAAQERLLKFYQTASLKGFGIQHLDLAIIASASVFYYMDMTEHHQLSHIQNIARIDEDKFVRLDRYTIRSLELCQSINDGGKSLLDVLDKTSTSMGKRLLRRWVLFPLKELKEINRRQNVVEYFFKDPETKEFLDKNLTQIGDLERMVSKISVGRISPRDVVYLKQSLKYIKLIKNYLQENATCPELMAMMEKVDTCDEMYNRIEKEIVDNPPIAVNRGEVIRSGVDAQLDELREFSTSGKEYLQKIQEREIQATGISSLKIAYNNVFGYYIEVRNTYKDKVPENWIRKQTLVSAERYVTPELKEYEEKIVGAEDRIAQIESEIFSRLVNDLVSYHRVLQYDAQVVAQTDCLLSFAKVAQQYRYCRPVMNDGDAIDIVAGRHPVIEQQLASQSDYIANDVHLDNREQQILMITGPNMAGKSAFIRQTALIVLMAQVGCFVPAESASIGLVDRIFTRVGASDNISLGESTFMVEMTEAADIINNISDKSLVLFDELGRGTSTYDGISIAWAIVEHLHEHPKSRAKTLFATHYHELNEMEKSFPRVRNYHISVMEKDNKVLFLRKLVRGGSEHSFGIHVAKMAGMPQSIVKRANEILEQFESDQKCKAGKAEVHAKPVKDLAQTREGYQLSFFQLDDPVLSQIRDEFINLDVDNLTPIQALNKLNDLKKIIRGKS